MQNQANVSFELVFTLFINPAYKKSYSLVYQVLTNEIMANFLQVASRIYRNIR